MEQQNPSLCTTALVLYTYKVRETRGISEKPKLHALSLVGNTDTKSELVENNEARQVSWGSSAC